jgi:hypothetical protein
MIQQAVLADYEKVVDRATIAVSDLRRISKLFFAHNSKVSTRKFGKLAPSNFCRFRRAVASFRSRVRFWLEVITASQYLCRSIGLSRLLHTHTNFITAPVNSGIIRGEKLRRVQRMIDVTMWAHR